MELSEDDEMVGNIITILEQTRTRNLADLLKYTNYILILTSIPLHL